MPGAFDMSFGTQGVGCPWSLDGCWVPKRTIRSAFSTRGMWWSMAGGVRWVLKRGDIIAISTHWKSSARAAVCWWVVISRKNMPFGTQGVGCPLSLDGCWVPRRTIRSAFSTHGMWWSMAGGVRRVLKRGDIIAISTLWKSSARAAVCRWVVIIRKNMPFGTQDVGCPWSLVGRWVPKRIIRSAFSTQRALRRWASGTWWVLKRGDIIAISTHWKSSARAAV